MILTKVSLRELTAEERSTLERLAHSRTAQARVVERAQILLALADGRRPSQVARDLEFSSRTASRHLPEPDHPADRGRCHAAVR